jgi:hypothetical protein
MCIESTKDINSHDSSNKQNAENEDSIILFGDDEEARLEAEREKRRKRRLEILQKHKSSMDLQPADSPQCTQ